MAESSSFEGYGVVLLCFSLGFTGLEKRKGEALRREQWLMERVRRRELKHCYGFGGSDD